MKNPIILLMNDLHVDKDSISEFNKNWDEALSICKSYGIDEIAIGGDLWTSRASQTLSVLLAVQNAVMRAQKQKVWLTIANGNHCKIDQESVDGYSSTLKHFNNVVVVDTSLTLTWEECDIALSIMSYFPETGSFTEKLDDLRKNLASDGIDPKDVILYIHEGIHGALGNFDAFDELPQDIFEGFRKVLVGHYHNRVKLKGTNIEYIGASRQLSFGEDEEKGYTLLYSDGSYEFIKNQVNVRYKTIELTLDQLNGDEFRLDDKEKYKYRLKLKCNSSDVQGIDRNKLVDLGFSKIEFVTEKVVAATISSTNISERYDKRGIRTEYVSFCASNGVDSSLGLRYL